ncbi:MAG: ferredoxin [Proteobacteria bacterium]|nr:MAG: ferredoxin [Pseudomonadota bacterium]
MDHVKMAHVSEFQEERYKTITLLGRHIGIFRRDDGSFFAVEISCKHQGANLLAGYHGGTIVTCPRHYWQYDLESGHCLNHESVPLRHYGVRREGDDILVTITPVD